MTHTITLSEDLYRQLQHRAQRLDRSVDEWIQETVKRELPPEIEIEEDLPPWLQAELKAMQELSDTALWALARSTMLQENQVELTELNSAAKERLLNEAERSRQQALLNTYGEAILLRAHAAVLLKSRGYDMSNPTVLQTS